MSHSKKKEAWEYCEKGDILAIHRRKFGLPYSHFAVYIGKGRVIHYAAESGDFGEAITGKSSIFIHKAEFSDFLDGLEQYDILVFPDKYIRPERKIVNLKDGTVTNEKLPSKAIDMFSNFFNENPDYHLYSPEETVERAKQKVGETAYNLVTNNCENFAIWCKTGISNSRQVEDFKKLMLTGILANAINSIR